MATRSRSDARNRKSRDDQHQPNRSNQNGTPDCIPFQLGDRACWAVRASGGSMASRDGATKSFDEIGLRRISGWLRIADESYVLVSEADGADSRTHGVGAENDAWEILSERETQIAVLVARGKGTKQIAGHLRISEHTVRSYMRRIFSKLRVSTRPAMVARLMQSGIALADLVEPHTGTVPPADARRAKSGL